MINNINQIKDLLIASATIPQDKLNAFVKTGPGDYAEHDKFIGVPVPTVRAIAKKFLNLSRKEISQLLASPFNEERLLGLIILIDQYQKADDINKNKLYQFYMDNLNHVNNWNLVDSSAHLITGAHLYNKNKVILTTLAQSNILWERRVAIIATLYFIRNNDLTWTFKIASLLLKDNHDLIHKAVGWMLREAGKKDIQQLINFLTLHAHNMPRTMLRYAIEKFPEQQRKSYLKISK